MTTTDRTDEDRTDADLAALAAHAEAVRAPHQLAWAGPIVHDYEPGAPVWAWDHYNTGVVVGPGARRGTWAVSTVDADGTESTRDYAAQGLRPALQPTIFTWTAPPRTAVDPEHPEPIGGR